MAPRRLRLAPELDSEGTRFAEGTGAICAQACQGKERVGRSSGITVVL